LRLLSRYSTTSLQEASRLGVLFGLSIFFIVLMRSTKSFLSQIVVNLPITKYIKLPIHKSIDETTQKTEV